RERSMRDAAADLPAGRGQLRGFDTVHLPQRQTAGRGELLHEAPAHAPLPGRGATRGRPLRDDPVEAALRRRPAAGRWTLRERRAQAEARHYAAQAHAHTHRDPPEENAATEADADAAFDDNHHPLSVAPRASAARYISRISYSDRSAPGSGPNRS